MIALYLVLGFSALFYSAVFKLNNYWHFMQSSRLLLRLAQALFLVSLVVPFAFDYLPVQHRPILPQRYTFPIEKIETSFSVARHTPSVLNSPIPAHPKENTLSLFSFTWSFSNLLNLVLIGFFSFSSIRFFQNLFKIHRFLKRTQVIKKSGKVRVALSEEISVPFSVLQGNLAWVVLPSSMLLQRRDYLIAVRHELQHHRQKDTQWILFLEFTGTFLFLNPGYYLWKSLFSELQEFSCDEALIHGQRISLHDYGDCLVRVAEAALENRTVLAGTASMASLFGNPKKQNSTLLRRIKMFKNHLSSRFQLGRFMVLGITTAVFTLAIAYGTTAKIEEANKEEVNPGTLTLDPEIQKIAENSLAAAVKRFKATSGFAIVSEPKSGRLLAVANTISVSQTHTPLHWGLKVRLQPASAMKALVAAKAVDLKLTQYEEKFNCHQGKMELAGDIYTDWKPFDILSTRDMVVQSSNLCAMEVAQRLGADNIHNMLKDFGFGRGGVTENFPEARFGQAFNYDEAKTSKYAANIGTGYNLHVTPLEMVQAFGAIANGGNLMKPLMANAPDTKIEVIRRVLSEQTAKETRNVLREVFTRGTASGQQSKIYELAGKTATASSPWLWDSNEQGGESNVGSFIGLGPVEDPKVLIYVGIYEPKDHPDHSAHGSSHGAPVFREIAEKVLEHMKVKP